MKIGVFTDAHYCRAEVLCRTRRPARSLLKIREAMEAFAAAEVDICLCLGDLTDHAPGDTKEALDACFAEAMTLIGSFGIPFYLVPGNHDYLMRSREELKALGIEIPPYALSVGGYRLIVLDANYRADGRCFDEAGVEWTDANLPARQCRFLKEALEGAQEPCIVCIHENLDPFVEKRHIVKNADAVRGVIGDKAVMVLQGHYHKGAENVINGVTYLTLPAMCEGTDNAYRILEFN